MWCDFQLFFTWTLIHSHKRCLRFVELTILSYHHIIQYERQKTIHHHFLLILFSFSLVYYENLAFLLCKFILKCWDVTFFYLSNITLNIQLNNNLYYFSNRWQIKPNHFIMSVRITKVSHIYEFEIRFQWISCLKFE